MFPNTINCGEGPSGTPPEAPDDSFKSTATSPMETESPSKPAKSAVVDAAGAAEKLKHDKITARITNANDVRMDSLDANDIDFNKLSTKASAEGSDSSRKPAPSNAKKDDKNDKKDIRHKLQAYLAAQAKPHKSTKRTTVPQSGYFIAPASASSSNNTLATPNVDEVEALESSSRNDKTQGNDWQLCGSSLAKNEHVNICINCKNVPTYAFKIKNTGTHFAPASEARPGSSGPAKTTQAPNIKLIKSKHGSHRGPNVLVLKHLQS